MLATKKEITCWKLPVFFLCCVLFLFGSAMEAKAESFKDSNGVSYDFAVSSNGGSRAIITRAYMPSNQRITSLTVPAKVRDSNRINSPEYPVVAIGGSAAAGFYPGAFTGRTDLVSITLPDSVCEIYSRSFEGLTNLQTISLNGDGIVINTDAFKGCNNLKVTFRGSGPVKHISGYAFGEQNSNCLDYNVISKRVDNNSWIGYDKTWNNEAKWRELVNSLTPFSIKTEESQNWEPNFEVLNAANGYPNAEQIVSDHIDTGEYEAWVRKAARWVNSEEEQAEIRLDVAYNPMPGKGSNDMIFVLDVSGSMYFATNLISGSNYSRQFQTFDEVRSVGKALLDLNEQDKIYNRVGATMFNNELRASSRSAADAAGGLFTDYANFIKWLDKENYFYNGATGYSFGLDAAADIINSRADKSRTPSVVFLSDGDPNTGTQGIFPRTIQGTTISGYGGAATTRLSNLGVTRYSILLGEQTKATLDKVTYVAGAPNTSNDSSKTYASPDAETLQKAFRDILIQVAENPDLSLADTAGNNFEIDKKPTADGGTIFFSHVTTNWDFSGTSPRQVYTLIIIQDLKRNSDDDNAFFYGDMETNLGDAILVDEAAGTVLSVGSPILNRAYVPVTIRVHVTKGLATGKDGTKNAEIADTITKTGSYTAHYEGNANTSLESIHVAAEGEARVRVSNDVFEHFYPLIDVRCDYDIWVVYQDLPGTWGYQASVENGMISSAGETNIPITEGRMVTYEPESDEHRLDYIEIGIEGEFERTMDEDELAMYSSGYNFPNVVEDKIYTIHVVYVLEEPEEEEEWIWGDYRR